MRNDNEFPVLRLDPLDLVVINEFSTGDNPEWKADIVYTLRYEGGWTQVVTPLTPYMILLDIRRKRVHLGL